MKWKLSYGTCVFSILEHTCKWDGTRNFSVIIQNVFVLKQNTSVKSRTRPKRQIYVQCVSPLSSLFHQDFALHWRPNWRHGVIKSNHQPHHSTVYSDSDQGKHQSSASLAFVRGIHRRPVNSPQKWPVTRKMVPLDDVIMDATMYTMVSGELPNKHIIQRESFHRCSKFKSISIYRHMHKRVSLVRGNGICHIRLK